MFTALERTAGTTITMIGEMRHALLDENNRLRDRRRFDSQDLI